MKSLKTYGVIKMGKDKHTFKKFSKAKGFGLSDTSKVHLFFERSGTFKKAFEKYGFVATDYDLEAEHEDVKKIDLFSEINKEFITENSSVFAEIKDNDLVVAFFPCTYFSDQSQLISRGDSFGMKDFSKEEKLRRSATDMTVRSNFYSTLCYLCIIAIRKNFKLIIENPYGKVNFLKQFFPIKPALVIKNRMLWGDFFKKPTQFFFINCTPNFYLERLCAIPKENNPIEKNHGFSRSRISSRFAENFIESVILD